jgi:transposase-like protein
LGCGLTDDRSSAQQICVHKLFMDTNIGSTKKRGPRGAYRHHSEQFKRAIVEQSLQPGVSVARLARENGVNSNQVFTWRKRYVADQHTVAQSGVPALLSVTICGAPHKAHARRKFYDLHAARPSALTTEALRRIGELYAIEESIRGKPQNERGTVRRQQSRPLLDDLERWLKATLGTQSRKSDTAAAILYSLKL